MAPFSNRVLGDGDVEVGLASLGDPISCYKNSINSTKLIPKILGPTKATKAGGTPRWNPSDDDGVAKSQACGQPGDQLSRNVSDQVQGLGSGDGSSLV